MRLALFVLAVAADVWTTILCRRRSELGELNPILRVAGSAWIPVRIGLAVVLVLVLFFTLSVPQWILPAATVFYSLVAAWNFAHVKPSR